MWVFRKTLLSYLPLFNKNGARFVPVASVILLLALTSLLVPSLYNFNVNDHMRGHRTPAQLPPFPQETKIGIDCGLGSTAAALNGTTFPVAPSETGAFETLPNCTWVGDVGTHSGAASDGTTEPLVTDQDETFSTISTKIGGGFTADIVYLQNATSTVNGFDITVSWNTKVLRAVEFDQGGLPWLSQGPFTSGISGIDNKAGTARLLQVIGTQLPGNFTFFRIRFDVVGIGNTALTIGNDLISNPSAVAHTHVDGAFDSDAFYDPGHVINWSASWTNSTPLNPGGSNTFTATVAGGTAPLSYAWQFNSSNTAPFKAQASANPATLTLPTSSINASRTTLRVTDSATPTPNVITIVHVLPLTAAGIQGPTSLGLNTAGTWNGIWLGGIASYTASWRFCPGTSLNTVVCAKPNPTTSAISGQNTALALTGSSPGYHFAGVYNVTMQIADAGSPAIPTPSSTTKFILVNVTGSPQVFNVQVSTTPTLNATVGFPVTVTASVSYTSTYPTLAGFRSNQFIYNFDFGDGSTFTSPPISGLTGSHSHNYTAAATYTARVTVQDTQSASKIQETGIATTSVATPVTGDFSFPASTLSGSQITFTATFSGGAPPYTYLWTFGDGTTGSGSTVAHNYVAKGNYTVTLVVTDGNGRTSTATHVLSIGQGASAPPASVDYSLLIYAGVGGAIAVVAVTLFLRRRRIRPPNLKVGSRDSSFNK